MYVAKIIEQRRDIRRLRYKQLSKRLKNHDPKAMITIEDLAYITADLLNENEGTECDGPVYESEEDQAEDPDDAYLIQDMNESAFAIEQKPANNSFVQGRSFISDRQAELEKIDLAIALDDIPKFKGILLDTCGNRSSVMSFAQYKAYCLEFQVPFKINRGSAKSISGIGGSRKTMGTATIPIPFKDLKIVIDVTFQIMEDYVPSFLSMKDMVENDLNLSIQRKVLMYRNLEQDLSFEIFFLIHRWNPTDMSYSLYTQADLQRLHRVFIWSSICIGAQQSFAKSKPRCIRQRQQNVYCKKLQKDAKFAKSTPRNHVDLKSRLGRKTFNLTTR